MGSERVLEILNYPVNHWIGTKVQEAQAAYEAANEPVPELKDLIAYFYDAIMEHLWQELAGVLTEMEASQWEEAVACAKEHDLLPPPRFRQIPDEWKNPGDRRLGLATVLDLRHRWLGDEALAAMLNNPALSEIEELNLEMDDLGPEGAQAIAQCPYLTQLTYLNLGCNRLGAEGGIALGQSPYLKALERIQLTDNHLGDEGLRGLMRLELSALYAIDLTNNGLTSAGARAIPVLPELRVIVWNDNELDAETQAWLEQHLPAIQEIQVYTTIDDSPLDLEGASEA